MSIKVVAQAHKLTLLYSVHDPSIIPVESNIEKYVETHDLKYLTFEDVDEEADQFGPTEFWVRIPEWSEVEPLFWEFMGDMRKLAFEIFRIYVDEFKNLRWRSEENGKINDLPCRKRLEASKGMVIIPQVLQMIPQQVQHDVGVGIMILGGIMDEADGLIAKLVKEIDENVRVVPQEHEKNS
jgi:hypothetical protein